MKLTAFGIANEQKEFLYFDGSEMRYYFDTFTTSCLYKTRESAEYEIEAYHIVKRSEKKEKLKVVDVELDVYIKF